jgi:hypothetical protein
MRPVEVLLSVLIVAASPSGAFAIILPSFGLDDCAWDASHIVVVTKGDRIDSAVEVLESWKGDLKKGDRLTIPELAAFAPEKIRLIFPRWHEERAVDLPKHVTCSRMVLFLVKKQEKVAAGAPAKTVWAPASSWDEMKVSMMWIEKGKAYAFAQQMNPGPSVLIPWNITECGVRCRVNEVIETQAALSRAIALTDPSELSAAVLPLIESHPEFRFTIIQTLGDTGPKALPGLRKLLKDESLGWCQVYVVSMARAGGASVGPELMEVVKEELAFWKKSARP